MGVLSKHHRYREAGEAANVNNVARFGEPDHSLFTTSKFFTPHRQHRHYLSVMFDAGDTKFKLGCARLRAPSALPLLHEGRRSAATARRFTP